MVTALRTGSVAMIALIGVSRVYLGAHWTSDVVGGLLFGGLTLGVLITAHLWWSRRGEAAEDS
jgi:undecaprenyl-diphosphatase